MASRDYWRARFPDCSDEFLDWWVRVVCNGPLAYTYADPGCTELEYLDGAVGRYEPSDYAEDGREVPKWR